MSLRRTRSSVICTCFDGNPGAIVRCLRTCTGRTQVADDGVKNYPANGAPELAFRHFEVQRAIGNSAPQTAHAFYCLSEDRAAESSAPGPTSLPGMTGSRSEW